MENAQKVQEGEDEISYLEKVIVTAEEYNNQPVVISQFTTAADIKEELCTKIVEGFCMSSKMKVASDRCMEDSEEISVKRKKRSLKTKSGDIGQWGVPDIQTQADSESAEYIRSTATNDHSDDTEKWESTRTFVSRLTMERDKGEIRVCMKRRGLVLFDITGEDK